MPSISQLKQKFKTWHAVLGGIVTVFALYGGAASVGLDIPRWAWVSEVKAADRKIDLLQIRNERLYLDMMSRQYRDVQTKIFDYESKGIGIPRSLEIEEESLRTDIQDQKDYLMELERELRGR